MGTPGSIVSVCTMQGLHSNQGGVWEHLDLQQRPVHQSLLAGRQLVDSKGCSGGSQGLCLARSPLLGHDHGMPRPTNQAMQCIVCSGEYPVYPCVMETGTPQPSLKLGQEAKSSGNLLAVLAEAASLTFMTCPNLMYI